MASVLLWLPVAFAQQGGAGWSAAPLRSTVVLIGGYLLAPVTRIGTVRGSPSNWGFGSILALSLVYGLLALAIRWAWATLHRNRVSVQRRTLLAATLVASTLHAISANAQERPNSLLAPFMSDSVAWQRILTYVVSSLSSHLVQTASDSSRQPWRISLPADEPQRALLEAQLRTILRARPVTPQDTVVYELEIGPFTVANDTGRVRVRTDFATRCPGSTRSAGYGNVDRVYVVRHPPGIWSIARTEGVLHGDRLGCPRPSR